MTTPALVYPDRPAERDAWTFAVRGGRNTLDPDRPYAFLVEDEPDATGAVIPVATIFLTNRECPWRCVMCDLWRNTLAAPTPPGSIPTQIEYALAQLPPARAVKLYNAGSFFDSRAIPPEDHLAIAECVRGLERVIVECHPALAGDHVLGFRDLLSGQLEVAMGLETANPDVLEKLNKRMTLDQFREAARFLRDNDIDLRVFILVQPPFERADESLHWAERSLDLAFDCGAAAATLIPTRGGNGAMEILAAKGEYSPPPLATLEGAFDYGLSLRRGRVFSDTWDLPRSFDCASCRDTRVARLRAMNLAQTFAPRIACEACGGRS
jgi:archaeosine synthase beta-subunit